MYDGRTLHGREVFARVRRGVRRHRVRHRHLPHRPVPGDDGRRRADHHLGADLDRRRRVPEPRPRGAGAIARSAIRVSASMTAARACPAPPNCSGRPLRECADATQDATVPGRAATAVPSAGVQPSASGAAGSARPSLCAYWFVPTRSDIAAAGSARGRRARTPAHARGRRSRAVRPGAARRRRSRSTARPRSCVELESARLQLRGRARARRRPRSYRARGDRGRAGRSGGQGGVVDPGPTAARVVSVSAERRVPPIETLAMIERPTGRAITSSPESSGGLPGHGWRTSKARSTCC